MEKSDQKRKIMRIVKMPIRILYKARDFYINSMNKYADIAFYGGTTWGPSIAVGTLSRSFSTNSMRSNHEEDLRELVRAASMKALGERTDLSRCRFENKQEKVVLPPKGPVAMGKAVMRVQRSGSVNMGNIDEDTPCDYEEDKDYDCDMNRLRKKRSIRGLFTRSRSYVAISRKE